MRPKEIPLNSPGDAIFQRLKSLHPKRIDLSLERVRRLLESLGNPQDKLAATVHVAGTNGKGSLIAFLRSCLEAAGYKVQAYTSPHLTRFNERIRLAGGEIGDENLTELLAECEDANGGEAITFFEITTAAAFLAFTRDPADILLLETGLGGRLDATNMVKRPALTAITPVSEDHHAFLGGTLGDIAAEKAGILKSGVACVLAAQSPAAMEAIEKRAKEIGAPLFVEGRDWVAHLQSPPGSPYGPPHGPPLGLVGAHQVQNAGLAVACLEKLDGFEVCGDALNKGLKNTHWPGRLQRLEDGALADLLPPGWELWLDGAHNPAGARALAVQAQSWKDKPLRLILGMMQGKDPAKFLAPLAGLAASAHAVPIPGEEGSLSAEDVAEAGRALGMDCGVADGIAAALKEMAVASPEPARVLVCGSLYLVGSALIL